MRKDFLVFGQPTIEQEEIDEVVDSMKKCWIGTGPKTTEFEKAFGEFKGVQHSAALHSCTAAMHLSCIALGLKPGDEVITTSMTFCATVNSIIHTGATPVLVDIDPNSLNIDTDKIEEKITPRTKALLIVHFAGRMCDMEKIIAIVKKHNLILIEDCAHAIESEFKGQKAGTFGNVGCFSFYATKNITTGEGGMVISADKNIISRIKIMALHGMSHDAWKRFSDDGYKHYYVEEAGFKYNMMDIQAAIGIHQLKRIEEYWQRRKKVWDIYLKAFESLPVVLPSSDTTENKHAYHLFTLRINKEKCGKSRDVVLVELQKRKIGCGVHYLSIPEHPFYQKVFNWKIEDYPNAVSYGRETVSIPLSPKLTDVDIKDVIDAVTEIISN